jgi:ornithine cyclodeaminase
MLRQGLIAPPNGSRSGRARCIDGELGDVLLGTREGRAGGREIIVVNPFGLALEDVAVARCVYERAVALGLGTSLER